MKKIISVLYIVIAGLTEATGQSTGTGSRLNEVFQVTELTHGSPGNTRFYDPWEVTYGPDDSLWITEAKTYKVYKVSPNGGTPRLILNIYKNSTFLPLADRIFNLQFNLLDGGYGGSSPGSAPQGGLAGLAIHPDFLNPANPKPYVYISYIFKFTAKNSSGIYYRNSLTRFTYNFTTGLLGSPVALCDTLPGSNDHNSQRIIISPVNGTPFLFYANGDMGAGQFSNATRIENAQNLDCYEGKILRFNLEPDPSEGAYDQWIPNDNPFNGTQQSAVWGLGIRNNQGFAYAKINGVDHLYGQSHGPFSDDEINVIQKSGNYGHPLVIGYAADGNYDGVAAGNPIGPATGGGGLPVIGSEAANAASLANYQDPIYTFYPALQGNTASPSTSATNTVQRMYYDFNNGSQGNGAWPSEAPSGLDAYTGSMIPGWKNSLVSAAMKGAPGTAGGRLIRLKLNATGDGVMTTASHNTDTTGYFGSVNRFRDLAFSPDGLSIFTIIDSSATTSGPTATNPINSKCKGCLLKFTFLGYYDNGTTSTLPDTIDIATGAANACTDANPVTISSAHNNTNLWVPITDANSNIVAEINANGNDLGTITTAFYTNAGAVRETGFNHNLYLDRNITITPSIQPATPVKVRLYLTGTEYTALKNATNSKGQPSNIASINSIGVFKNHDICGPVFSGVPLALASAPFTRTTLAGGTPTVNGYALQVTIPSFSTFYFANNTAPLALGLTFSGYLADGTAQLQWTAENETTTARYLVERSTDGNHFIAISTVQALHNPGKSTYHQTDPEAGAQSGPVIYYRLRIIDNAGNYTFSEIIPFTLPGTAMSVTVQPNPVLSNCTVSIQDAAAEQATWTLIDNTGRTVMQQELFLRQGANSFTISMSNLPMGIYYLTIVGHALNQQVKLEKL